MGKKNVGTYPNCAAATAKTLAGLIGTTVPATADHALVQCETQECRWRDDGAAPTAALGNLLAVKDTLIVRRAQFANFQLIEIAASTKVNVVFYKTG